MAGYSNIQSDKITEEQIEKLQEKGRTYNESLNIIKSKIGNTSERIMLYNKFITTYMIYPYFIGILSFIIFETI